MKMDGAFGRFCLKIGGDIAKLKCHGQTPQWLWKGMNGVTVWVDSGRRERSRKCQKNIKTTAIVN